RSNKNPVFYVQYAFARISGILAKSEIRNPKSEKKEANLSLLTQPAEMELAKKILGFPELIKNISKNYQTHLLTKYAIELAKSFHNFYENCPILNADDELKKARLVLLKSAQIALKSVLDIMGISAPEKM